MKKIFTKAVGLNLLIALGMFVVLLMAVQLGLKSYTRHGESIPVPDLKKKNMKEAVTALEAAGLRVVVSDSVYMTDFPPLSVVEQNPKAGAKVKSGRKVYLILNASSAPLVEVPYLVGRSSLKYARMQLQTYGLKLGETTYKPDAHYNLVIGMLHKGRNVQKGLKVPKGSVIDLLLGDGLSGGKIPVPYVLGLTLFEAKRKLESRNLNLGAIVPQGELKDTLSSFIVKQVPAYQPGAVISIGDAVDLFIASSLPDDLEIDPDLYYADDSLEQPEPR